MSASATSPFWVSDTGTDLATLYSVSGGTVAKAGLTVSGWRGALGTTAETLVPGSSSNEYTGVAYGTVASNSYIYAANFETGNIDVIPSGGSTRAVR
jgi:hypothetical protein